MLVWTLLTVAWHQDNLVRKTDFPWRTFIIQRPARGVEAGPHRPRSWQLREMPEKQTRRRLLWERRSDIKTENCYRVVIITSEVNIPNTYWPWPVFPQFSGKLQDTIAVSAGRVKRPAHRNQGEWENYFRQPGSWDQVTSCETQNINQILDSDFISNSWIH